MSAYIIDFSDPLRAGFSIPAGGFNGPGGSSSNTSLRLYGRGALEWGEAVDEDLVRLTENFASASSPSSAIAGQLWIERSLYYRDTSVGGVNTGWYYYDLNETAADKWKLVDGISPGTVTDIRVDANIEGRYYYWDGGSSNIPDVPQGAGLYGYYSLGRYEPASWRKRSATSGVGNPNAGTPLLPPQFLRFYNEETGFWSTPSPINLTPGATPEGPYVGMLWYNTTTGILQVYTSAGTWQNILGPTLGSGPTTSTGVVNMNGYNIINMANPRAGFPQDAATQAYVDAQVVSGGGALFVLKTGDTMTGNLNLSSGAGLTVSGTATFSNTSVHTGNATFTTLSSSGLATFNSASVTNNATVGGVLTVNGTIQAASSAAPSAIAGISLFQQRITGIALTPASANEAASKSYVDAQIAASGAGALTPAQVALISPSVPKNGDIQVVGGVISIYAAGAYRQVFPAQWAA